MELSVELPPSGAWPGLGLPAALPEYLAWAEGRGARRLEWSPEPATAAAVAAALRGRALAPAAVLPNMALYARDAMDAGPSGAVLKRLRALGPVEFARLSLRLLPRVSSLLEKRFAAGILLLADAEWLRLGADAPRAVVLHNSPVDLALALGCRELFDEFASWARARGVAAEVETSNPALWERRAAEWGLSGLPVRLPSRPFLRWTEWRPSTPESRLAAWAVRAGF